VEFRTVVVPPRPLFGRVSGGFGHAEIAMDEEFAPSGAFETGVGALHARELHDGPVEHGLTPRNEELIFHPSRERSS